MSSFEDIIEPKDPDSELEDSLMNSLEQGNLDVDQLANALKEQKARAQELKDQAEDPANYSAQDELEKLNSTIEIGERVMEKAREMGAI